MQYEIVNPGPFCMLKVNLELGESIKAESGAMVSMSDTIDVEGKMEGGFFKALTRKLVSGEKFFFQTLNAARGAGHVLMAHGIPGDIHHIDMDGSTEYILQKNGFFAGTSDLEISTTMQNLAKGLFSGEGFFVIRIGGAGILWVSSYGAIHPIDLEDGQEVIIDNSHLVAWPATMDYKIEKASSGWFSSWKSGEGLVCRFTGPGRVLIQTRNPPSFGDWIRQILPGK